jgi:hypothetical protein
MFPALYNPLLRRCERAARTKVPSGIKQLRGFALKRTVRVTM